MRPDDLEKFQSTDQTITLHWGSPQAMIHRMQPQPPTPSAPAPWALLDRAAAQEADLAVRYACLNELLAQDIATQDRAALALEVSAHWKVPTGCRDLARLLLNLPALAGDHPTPDADQVMQLLLASDALRRPERFRQ